MKDALIFAVRFAVCLLVTWAIGSFAAWDANPANWEPAGRFIVACFALVASFAATTTTSLEAE